MRRDFGSIQELEKGRSYKVYWTDSASKRHSHRVHGSRRDASAYLAKVQAGIVGVSDGITYQEYWESVVEPSFDGLAPLTVAEYESVWNRHLKDAIGGKPVAKTNFRNASSVLNAINPQSARVKAKRLWSKICNMAVREDGILQHNHVHDVKVPQQERKKKDLWSVQDIADALDKIRGLKAEPLVLLSIGCGLRPEECFALDWEDLVFEDGVCYVRVERTVVLVNNKMVMQDRTKTSGSKREAAVGGMFSMRLEELAEGKGGPIMPSSMGGRTSPSTIAHNWKRTCANNGIRHVTFENMRSNYKTLAANALIPAELVRMMMGHAGATVAETNYMVSTRPIMKMVAEMYSSFIEENAPHRHQE